MVADAPAFDGRTIGVAQRRCEFGRHRSVGRHKHGRPFAVLRQFGDLRRTASAAGICQAWGAPIRSVPRWNAGRKHRARETALPHAAGNHFARQSHQGVSNNAGTFRQRLCISLPRQGRALGLSLHARCRHPERPNGGMGRRRTGVSTVERWRHSFCRRDREAAGCAREVRTRSLRSRRQHRAIGVEGHGRPTDRRGAIHIRASAKVDLDYSTVCRRPGGRVRRGKSRGAKQSAIGNAALSSLRSKPAGGGRGRGTGETAVRFRVSRLLPVKRLLALGCQCTDGTGHRFQWRVAVFAQDRRPTQQLL